MLNKLAIILYMFSKPFNLLIILIIYGLKKITFKKYIVNDCLTYSVIDKFYKANRNLQCFVRKILTFF